VNQSGSAPRGGLWAMPTASFRVRDRVVRLDNMNHPRVAPTHPRGTRRSGTFPAGTDRREPLHA